MKIQLKQQLIDKVFMGLVLTNSLFQGVNASATHFESAQSDDDYSCQQVEQQLRTKSAREMRATSRELLDDLTRVFHCAKSKAVEVVKYFIPAQSDDEFYLEKIKQLSTESVREMGAKIREYQHILAHAKNKDLVVFLGNTGSGKSTNINILGNKRLIINQFGAFVLADEEDGFRVGGGGTSVTEYPQHLHSDSIGLVFDMPGFEDTGGTTRDIVNAALIKYLLENARSVRAVLTVSEPELLGLRGKGLQSVLKHIRMFSPEFLNQSVLLLINRLDPEVRS